MAVLEPTKAFAHSSPLKIHQSDTLMTRVTEHQTVIGVSIILLQSYEEISYFVALRHNF